MLNITLLHYKSLELSFSNSNVSSAEMVNLKEAEEVSDSDNESNASSLDNFEICSSNRSDHLLLHKPTFSLGTQSGL